MVDQETLVRELTDILRRASSVKVGFDTLLTELADAVGADAMLAPSVFAAIQAAEEAGYKVVAAATL